MLRWQLRRRQLLWRQLLRPLVRHAVARVILWERPVALWRIKRVMRGAGWRVVRQLVVPWALLALFQHAE